MKLNQYKELQNLDDWLWKAGLFDDKLGEELYKLIKENFIAKSELKEIVEKHKNNILGLKTTIKGYEEIFNSIKDKSLLGK